MGKKMCEGLRGFYAEGFAEGYAEGTIKILASLVQKELLTVKDAAEQAGMTVSDFQEKLTENQHENRVCI